MRICSLIPSATEMVFALGMGDSLVGVSHECDYPAQVIRLPRVTRSRIPAGLSSREIDRVVSSTLETTGSLYELDMELLEKLQPDLILTQKLCSVCAVSYDVVQEAVSSLKSHPQILSLEPTSLAEILGDIRTLGKAIGCETAAEKLIASLELRIDAVRRKTKDVSSRPRVFCMEWVDPPYCGGHWMKELVEIAGGRDDLSNPYRPSYRMNWDRVLEYSPEIIVLTCCGFHLERCCQEGEILVRFEGVHELPAAKTGRIFATDGTSYFSRSGPRIVDSLELLAHFFHPELFDAPPLPGAFVRLQFSTAAAFHA